jgi:hypothetical protein
MPRSLLLPLLLCLELHISLLLPSTVAMADEVELSRFAPLMRPSYQLLVAHRRNRGLVIITCVLALLSLLFWMIQGLGTRNFTNFEILEASSDSDVMLQAHGAKHQITPKIWQILLPKHASETSKAIDPGEIPDTPTWLALNTDYR